MTNLILPTLIVSILSLLASFVAIVLVLAQKFSTHRIDWKPMITGTPEEIVEKEMDAIEEDEDKYLAKALNLQRSKLKSREIDPLDEILDSTNF